MVRYVIVLFLFLSLSQAQSQEYEESFEGFIEKFSNNSSFQLSRLADTLIIGYTSELKEASDGTFSTETLEERMLGSKWKFDPISFKENVHRKIRLTGRLLSLEYQGVDNGVSVFYKFRLINGLWYLYAYYDLTY